MQNLEKRILLVGLALIASLGGFLFGYDTAVISGTLALVRSQFELNAGMEGWYVSSALVGCIIGVSGAGWLSDRYGRKMVLLLTGALFSISAIGCALSTSFTMLVWYRWIGGVGVGIASMLSPLYISEISPPSIRGRLVTLYQFAIAIGILSSYFVNAWLLKTSALPGFSSLPRMNLVFKEEVWRGMLGMEAIPAIGFFLLILFIPRSPRWLVVKGQKEKARKILVRLTSHEVADREIREIEETLAMEQGSWRLLLEPGIKMAVFIGIALAVLQQFTGIDAIIYYGPRIFEEAGFAMSEALGGQVVIGIINVTFTVIAIFTIDTLGRKRLLLLGTSGMFLTLILIGFLFTAGRAQGMLLLSLVLVFIACFAFSLGPVVWVLLSEIYPNRIRGRAMSIATIAVWIGTATIGQLIPLSLDNLGPH
ncbi:MAG: sugar porter family MFS transporter, partial [Cyclobacteriaceae bacterium]|nr:sugar porter family MFS transporter [Cyclobacteriaceae bacterium]